ncbi:MAG TPA: WD40 repeat domain-containing protein [Aggregatilineaceae bacterium]|nr:WD40 repeat domain-containing protein [Aggregatilineaceae bacterium]
MIRNAVCLLLVSLLLTACWGNDDSPPDEIMRTPVVLTSGPIAMGTVAKIGQVGTLEGNDGPVTFSPDSRTLAAGGDDGTIQLWDMDYLTTLSIFPAHEGAVRALKYSPDGARLVSSGDDGLIRVWDAVTNEKLLEWSSPPVYDLAFNPDGTVLAAGETGGTVGLWDVASGERKTVLETGANDVHSIDFNADGTEIAVGAGNTVQIWDVATGIRRLTLQGHTLGVTSVAYSPDGTVLASGGNDQTVRLWQPGFGAELAVLDGHAGEVSDLAFSPDGTMLASVDARGGMRLWNAATGETLTIIEASSGPMSQIVFSPNNQLIATTNDWDQEIRLWGAGFEDAALDVIFTEAQINALVMMALATYPDIKEPEVDFKAEGYMDVSFQINLFGEFVDASAKVYIGHDERNVSLVLTSMKVSGQNAPNLLVNEANNAIQDQAGPELNDQFARRVGGAYFIQSVTLTDTDLVITVQPE